MSYLQKKTAQDEFNKILVPEYVHTFPKEGIFSKTRPTPLSLIHFFQFSLVLAGANLGALGVQSNRLKRWDMIATHWLGLRIFQGRMPWAPLRVSLLREPSIPTEIPLPSVVNYGYCLKLCKICESKSSTEFLKLELNGPTYYCQQAAGCGC